MAEPRKCIGSTKFGIEAHQAPPGDFPAQPSQKDGLGRMCKPHWNQYTSALRKAALARKAEEGEVTPTGGKPEKTAKPATARRSKVEHPMAHIPPAGAKAARKPKAPKPESPKVRKAKEVVAATETLGGKAYTDAVGSEEVQAALEVLNGGDAGDTTLVAEEATFESDVRAILAEA